MHKILCHYGGLSPKSPVRNIVGGRGSPCLHKLGKLRKAHINVLELEALLLSVEHQVERFKESDRRIFTFQIRM